MLWWWEWGGTESLGGADKFKSPLRQHSDADRNLKKCSPCGWSHRKSGGNVGGGGGRRKVGA